MLSYKDLLNKTAAAVQRKNPKQNPQMKAGDKIIKESIFKN